MQAGLDHIDAVARAAHGMAFADLTPAQQTAQLMDYEAPHAAPAAVGRGDTETGLSNQLALPSRPSAMFFPLLKDLVTVGYFTSELGATRAVRYDPVPGAYRGCVPLSEIGRAWAQ